MRRDVRSREEARQRIQAINEPYKLEILDSIKVGPTHPHLPLYSGVQSQKHSHAIPKITYSPLPCSHRNVSVPLPWSGRRSPSRSITLARSGGTCARALTWRTPGSCRHRPSSSRTSYVTHAYLDTVPHRLDRRGEIGGCRCGDGQGRGGARAGDGDKAWQPDISGRVGSLIFC